MCSTPNASITFPSVHLRPFASLRHLDLATRSRASPSEPTRSPPPSQGWAPCLRARFRCFQLTTPRDASTPSSPTPINSPRTSAPSIRRPCRSHRPARPPEPPPSAVWALPPPHATPQSPLFLALPGAQDLGFHGAVTAGAKGPPCRSLTTGRADGAHRDRVDPGAPLTLSLLLTPSPGRRSPLARGLDRRLLVVHERPLRLLPVPF